MTTLAIRSPLQLITNTHYMMSDQRRSTRRSSARLAEKEDVQLANGSGNVQEKAKASQTNNGNGKSVKAGTSGAGSGIAATRSKRKMDYDEDDDGFQFTRKKAKSAKAVQSSQAPEPIIEEDLQSKPPPARRSRKKSIEAEIAAPVEKEERRPARRSSRNSGGKASSEVPDLQIPKTRGKQTRDAKSKRSRRSAEAPVEDAPDEIVDAVGLRDHTPVRQTDSSKETTKIALPFADTPIIRRNQEMRKGSDGSSRRSSLGMRGRRASSLIDSGTSNALPHDEVDSAQFYKHIESGLPEPRRMRQLLTWCGTRALGAKPSFATEDSHAKLAAREIQTQLLQDFSSKSEMSDWFARDEEVAKPQTLKPNPRNITNQAKIEELEKQLERLQSERKAWESLLRPPKPDAQSLVPLPTQIPTPSDLSTDLLSTSETQLLTKLQSLSTDPTTSDPSSLATSIRKRIDNISNSLEFQVDKLADSVHILDQHGKMADKLAMNVLGQCARLLEEREQLASEKSGGNVGMRDVLRGLSAVLERERTS